MNTQARPPQRSTLRRWLPRFSLRTLVVAMGVLGVGLGCVGIFLQRLRLQRQVVAKIKAAGGDVIYDYEFGAGSDIELDLDVSFRSIEHTTLEDGRSQRTEVTSSETVVEIETPPGPRLVRSMLGDDAFAHVEVVSFFDWHSRPPGDFDSQLVLQLPQLKVVLLVGPQVNDEWLQSVAQAPQMQIVNLRGDTKGSATATGLEQLRSAQRLESLRVTGQWLQDETLVGVANLRQLNSLQLADVPNVTSAIYSNLSALTELRQLYVVRAKNIDDEGSEVLSRLKQLRMLTLGNTSISDETLGHLRELKELEKVDVSWTNVGDPGMEHLAQLSNLVRVNVKGTNVGDRGLAVLARLPRLRYLNVGPNVSDAGLKSIASMTQLETLDLYPSAITDAGLQQLQSLKQLRRLDIGPHVTAPAANVLRAALPECEVTRWDQNGSGSSAE